MNRYLKNILGLTIGVILLLICLLVFLKHSQFGTCYIVNQQNRWTLMLENKTYDQLADKNNLIIKNQQIEIKLTVKNNWIFNYTDQIWSAVVYDINFTPGQYQVFLDYKNLLW